MASYERDQALSAILEYARQARDESSSRMEVDTNDAELETRLDASIKQLEDRVEEQRKALEQIQARSQRLQIILTPSTDASQRLRQLQAITNAYESLTAEKPNLPDPDSPIPAALAAQAVRAAISGSASAMDTTHDHLARSEAQSAASAAALSDAHALAAALRARIAGLEDAKARRGRLTAAERADGAARARLERAAGFEREAARLRRALAGFVRARVGALLAAEELGGAVAGTLAGGAGEEALLAARKSRSGAGDDGGRRQMRIDEIWGAGGGGAEAGAEGTPEVRAACDEVAALIDGLLRALAGESDSGVYVDLRRDSAAARFLVRAKVAQYHPKDARKLRLVDFGRELDA